MAIVNSLDWSWGSGSCSNTTVILLFMVSLVRWHSCCLGRRNGFLFQVFSTWEKYLSTNVWRFLFCFITFFYIDYFPNLIPNLKIELECWQNNSNPTFFKHLLLDFVFGAMYCVTHSYAKYVLRSLLSVFSNFNLVYWEITFSFLIEKNK